MVSIDSQLHDNRAKLLWYSYIPVDKSLAPSLFTPSTASITKKLTSIPNAAQYTQRSLVSLIKSSGLYVAAVISYVIMEHVLLHTLVIHSSHHNNNLGIVFSFVGVKSRARTQWSVIVIITHTYTHMHAYTIHTQIHTQIHTHTHTHM